MKKYILFVSVFLLAGLLNAQTFNPTTKWPYVYKNFQVGTIYFSDKVSLELQVNIHLLKSALHYVKQDMIYHSDTSIPIDSIMINNNKYVYMDNQLVEVISEKNKNKLVLLKTGDFDVLFTTTGAYGTAAHTSAVNDLASYEIGGISNMNHRQLVLEKEDGKLLPVKTSLHFIIDGKSVAATKKGFREILDTDKYKQLEDYTKANKINWKNIVDLQRILVFFE